MSRESTQRSRKRSFLGLLLAIAACAQFRSVEGPSPPAIPTISSVVITQLEAEGRKPKAVNDPAKIQAILSSYAFSKNGWVQASGRRLVPLYRLDLRTRDGAASVYWLGTNSYPPHFPCYALCTGWWLAPSSPSGDLDLARYKPLPDSVYLPLLRDLDLP